MAVRRIVPLLALLAAPAFGYEPSMLNMTVPSGLERRQIEVRIQHRFAGQVAKDRIGNFLGMEEGANTALGLRAPVWRRLEINGGWSRNQQEYYAGAGYARVFGSLHAGGQVDLQFFSYRLTQSAARRQNVFGQFTVQSLPIRDRVRVCGSMGYDAYNLHAGSALGASIEIAGPLALMAEYFPVIGRKTGDTYLRRLNAYCLGLKLTTAGHQFVLTIGNGTEIGSRRLMLGADARDLHFGFNIQRMIEW